MTTKPKINGLVWDFKRHNFNTQHGLYYAVTKLGVLCFNSDDLIVCSTLNNTVVMSKIGEIRTIHEAKKHAWIRFREEIKEL